MLRFVSSHAETIATVAPALLALVAITGIGRRLEAQCVSSSDRPVEDFFRSDVVYPQERGEMQVEVAPSLVNDHNGQSAGVVLSAQYGLTSIWQLESSWDGPARSGQAGGIHTWDVGNLEVGAKRSFPCVGIPANHASVSLDLELPTATGISDRRIRIQPSAIFGRDVPAIRAHIFTQLLLSAPIGSAAGTSPTTSATGTRAQGNLGMFVKSGAFRATGEFTVSRGPETATDLTITPGVIWHSSPFEIGVGAMFPVSQGAGKGALVHVVYEFGGGGEER